MSLPLEEVAEQIRVRWKKSDDYRLQVALMLAEVKTRIEAGEEDITWKAWVKKFLPGKSNTSIGDLVRIGSSPDPEKALQDLRAANAANNRALRERAGQAPALLEAPPPIPLRSRMLEQMKSMWLLLTETEQEEFLSYARS